MIGRIDDLYGFLAGEWALYREIVDRSAGASGEFRGTAVFAEVPEGLQYTEQGNLLLRDHEGTAFRRYRYLFPELGVAHVLFEDGRPFHDLDLRDGTWQAFHLCGDDRYLGWFAATGPGAWEAEWEIEGPRKRLRLHGHYSRG